LNSSTIAESLEDKRKMRLNHVRLHMTSDQIPGIVYAVNNRTGDTAACISMLSLIAVGNALISWFDKQEIQTMKNWWHTSASLQKKYYEMKGPYKFNTGGKFMELMPPLLSDDNDLISWYAHADVNFDLARVEDHKTHDFWSYQALLALRGDWSRLRSRCERVLADPPKASKEQKYLIDHRFYLALAEGDEKTMSDIIQQLVTPKLLRARRNYESGYTGDLISTPAVIFSKLARRAGFDIDIKSPFVPSAWLAVAPLPRYEDNFHLRH
jgi:hypothetical protein